MSTVPLTITYANGVYTPDPTTVELEQNDTLQVTPPADGCTIHIDAKVGGSKQLDISEQTDYPIGTTPVGEYKYCITALDDTCEPENRKRGGGHTIKINGGI